MITMRLRCSPLIFVAAHLLAMCVMGQQPRVEQECEAALPDGTIGYLACVGRTEPLHLLQIEPRIEPEFSTCGLEDNLDRSIFCALDINFRCGICNASNETTAHPQGYMVDPEPLEGAVTWWQSISWYDYPVPLEIDIILSLDHPYTLNGDITITFQSGRPQAMVLDKSTDHGRTWETLQYYARDCEGLNLTASRNLTNATEVLCVKDYSANLPRSGGAVQFDVASRFGLFGYEMSPALLFEALENDTDFLDFLRVTDLRIKLLHPATDGLEISGQSLNLPKYYYAISDIDVFLICDCNLHGDFCRRSADGVACECQHNTMGVNCEQCLPLYNNRPWRKGSRVPYPTGTANECHKCECNGHAAVCSYNATLQHGVCEGCTHNTTGLFCDVCVPGYYPDLAAPINSVNRCIQCDCNPLGTLSSVCSQSEADGIPTGQCSCEANVTGRSCDRCIEGYFGLASSGSCQACSCDPLGTINGSIACDPETGQCPCKPSITGNGCDLCQDEFFQYPSSGEEECLPCSCDPGGSLSPVCHNETGNCQCRDHISGVKCSVVDTNYFVPSFNYLTFDAFTADSSCQKVVDTERVDVSGQGYLGCSSHDTITIVNITASTDIPRVYRPAVRYSYTGLIPPMEVIIAFSISHNASGASSCPYRPLDVVHSVSDVTFLQGEGAQAWIHTSGALLVIEPSCSYEAQITMGVVSDEATLDIDSLMLIPVPDNLTVFQLADEQERVAFEECLRGSVLSEELPNDCSSFEFSALSELFNGALDCDCHQWGSLSPFCSGRGGQCLCRPGAGVGGRSCDQCLPGYHSFGLQGCTACNCNGTFAVSGACDYQTGQCFCKEGVALSGEGNVLDLLDDLQCSSCLLNHYPADEGCGPCDCNLQGSVGGQCNPLGACACRETIGGDKCDQCSPGYYNFTTDGCMACDCIIAGSTSDLCHPDDGTCSCKDRVQGLKCDLCAPGTFNLQGGNPRGCQECFCYGHATECGSSPNFVKSGVVTNFRGDSLNGWQVADMTSVDLNPSNVRVSHPPRLPMGSYLYLGAPRRFLGDRMSSYGLSFRISLKLDTGTVSQPGAPILKITGGSANDSMSYSDPNALPTTRVTEISAVFYEDWWSLEGVGRSPTRSEFNGILTDISTLEVRASFGVDTVATFYFITMEGAEYRDVLLFGDELVYSIEQCDCVNNTAGNSCESCMAGTFRIDSESGQYSGCTPCECNGRAQSCDPDSGLCLVCLPGTTGGNCESCAPNIQGPDCLECLPDHYGYGTDLFVGGCAECACNSTGTLNQRLDCRNDDGQCFCKPSFGGRQCARCNLNHYGPECLPCDVCYDFVLELLLASGVDELDARMSSTDAVSGASFMSRYGSANEQLLSLMTEVEEVEFELSGFREFASELNTTLFALMDRLAGTENSLDDDTDRTIIQENIDMAQDTIGNITVQLEEAYTILNDGTLQELTDDLNRLTSQLNLYEGRLSTSSVEASGLVEVLELQVSRIRNTTERAVGASAMALQTVLAAHAAHDRVTSRLVLLLTESSTVDTTISSLREDVEELRLLSDNMVTTLLQSSIGSGNNATRLEERLVNLRESLEVVLAAVGDTSGEIDAQLIHQQSLSEEVQDALNITGQLRGASIALGIGGLSDRVGLANQRAASAVAASDQLFAQAEIQLEVVQDFQNISAKSQRDASAALDQSPGITSEADNAYSSAIRQRESLSSAAMCATDGLDNATSASHALNSHQMDISSLNDQLDDLQTRTGWDESYSEVIRTVNNTVLQPAVEQCSTDRERIQSLGVAASEVEDNARQATVSSVALARDVASLLQQLRALDGMDLSQLDSLRSRVSEVGSRLTQSQYQEAAGLLREALNEQNGWIEATTREIATMGRQIEALESFQVN